MSRFGGASDVNNEGSGPVSVHSAAPSASGSAAGVSLNPFASALGQFGSAEASPASGVRDAGAGADTPSRMSLASGTPPSVGKDPVKLPSAASAQAEPIDPQSYTSPEYLLAKARVLTGDSGVGATTRTSSYTSPAYFASDFSDERTAMWPNEPAAQRVTFQPSSYSNYGNLGDTGDYLTDFYGRLIEEVVNDAQDTMQRLVHQEMDLRRRLYALGNADLFRVRFIEEARWELRERHEVIARREKLERSRIENWLLERVLKMLVSGGGRWSEDVSRADIQASEEREWRQILQAKREAYRREEESQWEAYLMAEDRWRWDVELASRHGMHQIQLDEHRHRAYLEMELYPANLAKLLHAMELEWCDLLRSQEAILYHQVSSNLTKLIKDEEDERADLKRRNKKIMAEFHLLHGLLGLQHLEESERELVADASDRLFAILFSRENVHIRALEAPGAASGGGAASTAETAGGNGSTAAGQSPRQAPSSPRPPRSSGLAWGGEVYPELVMSSPLRRRDEMESARERVVQIQELGLDRTRTDLDRQRMEQVIKEQELQKKMNEVATKSRLLDLKLSEATRHVNSSIGSFHKDHLPVSPGGATTPSFLASTPSSLGATGGVPLKFYQRSVPIADLEAAAALLN